MGGCLELLYCLRQALARTHNPNLVPHKLLDAVNKGFYINCRCLDFSAVPPLPRPVMSNLFCFLDHRIGRAGAKNQAFQQGIAG